MDLIKTVGVYLSTKVWTREKPFEGLFDVGELGGRKGREQMMQFYFN